MFDVQLDRAEVRACAEGMIHLGLNLVLPVLSHDTHTPSPEPRPQAVAVT